MQGHGFAGGRFLVKTHAFCYVAEMEMTPPRQILSFVDTISVEQAVTGD